MVFKLWPSLSVNQPKLDTPQNLKFLLVKAEFGISSKIEVGGLQSYPEDEPVLVSVQNQRQGGALSGYSKPTF